jgi:hypothetical protein
VKRPRPSAFTIRWNAFLVRHLSLSASMPGRIFVLIHLLTAPPSAQLYGSSVLLSIIPHMQFLIQAVPSPYEAKIPRFVGTGRIAYFVKLTPSVLNFAMSDVSGSLPILAPLIDAFAEAIRPLLGILMIHTIFGAILIPLLITVTYLSTSKQRRGYMFWSVFFDMLLGLGVAGWEVSVMVSSAPIKLIDVH